MRVILREQLDRRKNDLKNTGKKEDRRAQRRGGDGEEEKEKKKRKGKAVQYNHEKENDNYNK